MPSADALYRFCINEEPGDEKACHGYLQGFVEYHQYLRESDLKWCLPKGWNTDGILRAIMPRLREAHENPEWGKLPAYGFIAIAIAESFACGPLSHLSDEELLDLLDKLERKERGGS